MEKKFHQKNRTEKIWAEKFPKIKKINEDFCNFFWNFKKNFWQNFFHGYFSLIEFPMFLPLSLYTCVYQSYMMTGDIHSSALTNPLMMIARQTDSVDQYKEALLTPTSCTGASSFLQLNDPSDQISSSSSNDDDILTGESPLSLQIPWELQ